MKGLFLHHVFFTLKNPSSKEDFKMMEEGLRFLSTCPQINSFHIGIPADTEREVIVKDYHFSWFTTFASALHEEAYQIEPIHLAFIENCSHLWSNVRVFDCVDV
jgi:Stress responsive A/B Barrel Domain